MNARIAQLIVAAAMIAGAAGMATRVGAAVPPTLNYQGYLTDGAGNPVTGTPAMDFRIYDALTNGNLLFTDAQPVAVTNGIFNVVIGGMAVPLNLAFDKPYFLEVGVGGQVLGPRQPLASSAYAFRAAIADAVANVSASQLNAGTLPDARLAPNISRLDGVQTRVGPLTFADQTLLLRNVGGTFSTTVRASGSTAARVLDLPDAGGTIITTGNLAAITAVGSVASGTWNGTAIGAAKGGTGIDTSVTPAQSLLRTTGTGTWASLGAGAEGQVLKITGGALAWGAPGVTSVATGSGLTGGTITATGTIGLAASQLLPTSSCGTGQIPKWSGTAWTCGVDNNSAAGGAAGQVLTGNNPAWTSSPTLGGGISLGGSITLVDSSAAAGNLMKGTYRFLHNFGYNNTFAGQGAGNFTMTGFGNNTAFGTGSLSALTSGEGNTATGSGALYANTSGKDNTAAGLAALESNSSGNYNTAVGTMSLGSNTTAEHNTAVGMWALHYQSYNNGSLPTNGVPWTSNNTAVGSYALASNQPTTVNNGVGNTGIGARALGSNQTGYDNAALGLYALGYNTTAANNTAVGNFALQMQSYDNASATYETFNTAVGYKALQSNQPTDLSNGVYNTAVGALALQSNQTGVFNAALGTNALQANTTGSDNTANGNGALYLNVSGSFNVGVGLSALYKSTGDWNVGIGTNAGLNLTTGDKNVYIANTGLATESGSIRIGNTTDHTATYVAGISGKTSSSGTAVYVNASGQLGTTTSSARYKDDIADMGDASALLLGLRPVTFRYKPEHDDGSRLLQYGLLAEEVDQVEPGLVARSADGRIETVRYQFLAPMLVNEVQKQQRTIAAQAARIDELEQDRAAQQTRMVALEAISGEVAALKAQMATLQAAILRQR